jgi:hypothetical protein
MLSIKPILITSLCAMGLMACNADVPSPDEAATDETSSPEQMGDAPEIGTFTFDELDLAGCGMSLWAPGSDPRADGVYLFNGIEPPSGAPEGTMRMKIDGDVVKFQRTETAGDEYYGQFTQQTFESLDGDLSAEVGTEVVSEGPDPEVMGVEGTITVINSDGQETTVEAVGDAGC